MADIEDLADRLEQLSDELGDIAFDRLRHASESAGRGSRPDPSVLAEERRLTRARRAIDKAVMVLRAPAPGSDVDA